MTSKSCSVCRQSKPIAEFNVRRASGDGRQSLCRECNRAKARRYYERNRERHVRVIMARKARQRLTSIDAIEEYLWSHPCVDCGESDLRVLDFDHRPGSKKTAEVMRLVQDGYSVKRVMAEVANCDVRCRNCHARVTYERSGASWRSRRYPPAIRPDETS